MGVVLRMVIVVLVLSGILLLTGLLLGHVIATEVVTDDYTLEDRTYSLQIRDDRRGFYFELAGSRCFEPLPPWAEEDAETSSTSLEGQFSQTRYKEPLEAIDALRC